MNLEGQYYTIELAYSLFLLGSCFVLAMSLLRKQSKKQVIQGLFLAYCIQIVYFTMFNNAIYVALDQQAQTSITAVFGTHPFLFKNLVPFSSIADQFFWHYWDISTILNILMTVPLGMLIVTNWRLNNQKFQWRRLMILGFLFSVTIESSQLLMNISLGYRYRIVTSDDVLMNIIGVCLGAAMAGVIYWLWQKSTNYKRRKQ
ncbi:MAG: VanZ family protein [Culicoidibacterales bacterium]